MAKSRAAWLPESAYDGWSELVRQSPDGSAYSLPEYLDALCTAAGGRFRVLGLYRGDELYGGVAVYERTSFWGRYVSPRLLLYYNGPVLRHNETKYPSERTAREVEGLTTLAAALEAERYGAITLKSRGTLADARSVLARGWSAWPSYTYVVSLVDLKTQWERVEQNLRRLVRRCTESKEMTVGSDDDFSSFYRLHSMTLGRKGLAEYLPRDSFGRYFANLHRLGLARLYHAKLANGRTVASQLVLLGHAVTHTVSAAGDPEFNRTGAQAFLRWGVFEALAAEGYTANDLTDAALNPVTHFKAQLGGDLVVALVLESPRRLGYRVGTEIASVARRLRGAAGSVGRHLLSRDRT